MKKYGILSLKILLSIIAFVLILVALVYVLIQVPRVQNYARIKVVNFLEKKIKTPVEINKLSIDFPNLLVLEDVYFEDQQGDTLLAGDTLKVNISLFKLLDNSVELNLIDLRGMQVNVSRNADSVFNFDYILDAFITEQAADAPPADSSAAMKFALDKINLDRINVKYRDVPTANQISFALGHFDTRVTNFNLEKMSFSIPAITLNGLNAKISQGKAPVNPEPASIDSLEATQPFEMDLNLGTIDLKNFSLDYQNDVSAIKADLKIPMLSSRVNSIDMRNQLVDLEELVLHNSNSVLSFGNREQAAVVAKEVGQEVEAISDNWKVNVAKIDLRGNDVKYDDNSLPRTLRGMDYAHLSISDLSLAAKDLQYSLDSTSASVLSGSFKEERSNFDLQELRTDIIYSNTRINLADLYIKTSRSVIKDRLDIRYKSLASIAEDPGNMKLEADLVNSKIAVRDILIFVPDLADVDMFRNAPNDVLLVDGEIRGSVADMYIPSVSLSGYRQTRIQASGRIKGLPDMEKAVFDLNIGNLQTRSADLLAIMPRGTVPSNIRLPDAMQLKGTFRGAVLNFNTNLNLNSSFGSARAIASYDGRFAGREKYNADLRLYNFDVGRLIMQDTMVGRVTMVARVKGTGIDPASMSNDFSGKVITANYNGYAYRNLDLSGQMKNGSLTTSAIMNDPNLDFKGKVEASFSGAYPSVKLEMDLDSADFKKLNFLQQDVRMSARIVADLPTADPDFLNGNIQISNAILAYDNQRYVLDSISLVSTANADSSSLSLKSEVLTADLSGKYKLTEISYALQDVIDNYFSFGTPTPATRYSPQLLAFKATLVNGPLIQSFMPELSSFDPILIEGNFNSSDSSLALNANAPRIVYGTNNLNGLTFNAGTDNGALNYSTKLASLDAGSMQILNASVYGSADNDILTTNVQVKDQSDKIHYLLAGELRSDNPDFVFSLNEDGLILNYETWTVGNSNEIRFGSAGFQASNFQLENNSQRISVNTTPPGLNNPVKVDFDNFKIETITAFVSRDSILAGGNINGTLLASDLATTPVFTADMNVEDFNFMGDTLGRIDMQVNNSEANLFAANMRLSGFGNDLRLAGNYNTSSSTMDMDLVIENLNLESIEGFTFGSIDSASGSIQGSLDIRGTIADPSVTGDLNFEQAAFNLTMLNSYFRIQDNAVRFNGDEIIFDNFTLIDSANNTASLNGTIQTDAFTDYTFALNLESNNFQVMNSAAEDNELYYGKLFVDADLEIGGSLAAPSVNGEVKVNEESKFTVVLPQADPAIEEREGIVEFVDMDHPELASVLTSGLDSLSQSDIVGMNLAVNLTVDKDAEFNIIIDEANGDFLMLKGEADLSAGIDPSGKVSLTGSYNLEEGAYELSFNFLKRRFEIDQGSSIVWNGEPMMADVNVSATYIANTAPLDLVDNALGDAPQAQRNIFKQELPFEVNLSMQGELMKPVIDFDIVLPERNYNVSTEVTGLVNTRLEQLRQEPSELNKQVFALLLLNRFVGENPFAGTSGGGGAETLVRQSVSKILSQQLNELAGDLIAGVDLNFDLQTTDDYTTGARANRTDLNVGLSKQLLNDRLRVNVGSNFELEGPQQPGARTSNFAGDVSVEYQLSRDGRYLLRAYQKNEYQMAIQGQVIETGLGFVLSMDYNKFYEIFRARTEDTKRRRKIERDAKKAAKNND